MNGTEDRSSTDKEAGRDRALDAVIAFSERLAHDANNYIGAILGLSELLPAVADDPEQVASIAAKISAAGRLLQIAVNQPLLAYAPSLVPPRLDAGEAFDAARMLAENLVPRRITVALRPCESETTFGISRREFSSVLFILLRNAIDAIGEQPGHIEIVMEEISPAGALLDDHHIYWRGAFGRARYLALSVTDSAARLPAGDVSHLFQPFKSDAHRKSALGLGLGFASAILESREGVLAVSRVPDTRFTAFIPAVDVAEENVVDLPEEARIIIVDPLKQWGNVAAVLLDTLGRMAICVATVEIAAGLLGGAPSLPHVVVLRAARTGMSSAGLKQLRDVLAQRMNIDLPIIAGAQSAEADVAALLEDMAAVQLGAEAEPADLINYLIPHI